MTSGDPKLMPPESELARIDEQPGDAAQRGDSVGAKLWREVELLTGGTAAGLKEGLSQAWERPGESALKIGGAAVVGAGLSFLNGRAGMLRVGAQVAGLSFGFSFLRDADNRMRTTARAMSDTWHSPADLELNKRIVAGTLGPFMVDGLLMTGGGLAGARVARIPRVHSAMQAGAENLQSRVPTLASLQEARLLKQLERYHPESAQHSQRVTQYSMLIAEQLGLPRARMVSLRHAARMHDIGKLDVPLEVLGKPGRLNSNELAVMRSHASHSYERLSGLRYPRRLKDVPEVAAGHHEYLDGSGYFRGLKGDQIPLETRIITVADVFDAMTQVRVYKPRNSIGDVQALFSHGKGVQFDPLVVEALSKVRADKMVQVLESAPGRPKLPSLKPLKEVTWGRLMEMTEQGRLTQKPAPAASLFTSLYTRKSRGLE